MLDVHSHEVDACLHGLVAGIYSYANGETAIKGIEPAPLTFPLLFSLAAPWRVGFGTQALQSRPGGFAAGLFAGPVWVETQGGVDCVQVDLTLRGALRLYGGLAADLAGRAVDLAALPGLGRELTELQDGLSDTTDRLRRFDRVEQFLLGKLSQQECRRTIAAWGHLAAGHSVADAADAVGWSARHLHSRVKAASGLKPAAVARMMRLHRAMALARMGGRRWADVAVDAGYADQAHLVREFRALAGETPTAWAARPSLA